MKKYIKPDAQAHELDFYAILVGGASETGYDTETKRNDGWEYDDEDEDDGLW
ncbi:MAG: hypothetical protein LUI08_02655 [Prevotella sp.]|nr:hypothetical protein [Prevotella sp.]